MTAKLDVVLISRCVRRREKNIIQLYALIDLKPKYTDNKRLRSRYCTVKAITTDTKHRAASLRQQNFLLLFCHQNVTCLKRFTRYGYYTGEMEDNHYQTRNYRIFLNRYIKNQNVQLRFDDAMLKSSWLRFCRTRYSPACSSAANSSLI